MRIPAFDTIAAFADQTLKDSPIAFALVCWVRGEASDPEAVTVTVPEGSWRETPDALATVARKAAGDFTVSRHTAPAHAAEAAPKPDARQEDTATLIPGTSMLRHADGRTGTFVQVEPDGRYLIQASKNGFWVFHPTDCERVDAPEGAQ